MDAVTQNYEYADVQNHPYRECGNPNHIRFPATRCGLQTFGYLFVRLLRLFHITTDIPVQQSLIIFLPLAIHSSSPLLDVSVVGTVETRALENNANITTDKPFHLAPAIWTFGQWGFGYPLLLFESAAIFTSVIIDWHVPTPF
jgi:hypothetical protein